MSTNLKWCYYLAFILSAIVLGAILAFFYLNYEFDPYVHGVLTVVVLFILGAQIYSIRLIKRLKFNE